MGKVVETKRKKKGRPSLLDLQKRKIKEQNETQQRDNSAHKPSQNHNHATPTPPRRSTRRNPAGEFSSPEGTTGGDDDDMSSGRRRRENKLNHVLKLSNSGSGNQGGSESEREEEEDAVQNQRKRKIEAIGDGSGAAESGKGENPSKSTSTRQGIQLDSKVSTPLPDKKLLLFVLERIQKKDTYGVFSEPVDPEELPDYHEIIEHPMDFGTVRKKFESGSYANLEQCENDVFLICSNAMQYNAPDTVYFRQARAIQELARKNFENLRQDSDDNNKEREPKRRGRPPTKNVKRPPGRPPLDRAASSDATLATGGENAASANHDLRKAQFYIDKSGLSNYSGRPRINDIYANWVSQYRSEQNDAYAGSSSKGSPLKSGKKQAVPDEDRRSTYMKFDSVHEPSVLATFSRERKQLMTVGLHSDHGYGRSLARFAANLGPVAWKIASKMIEKSLPSGVKFGPGWVGENDLVPHKWLQPPSASEAESSSLWPFSTPGNSALPEVENRATDSREKVVQSSEGNPKASQPLHKKEEEEEATVGSGLTMSRPQVAVQVHQKVIQPGSNGFNSPLSYNNIEVYMGKLIGGARPPSFGFHSQNSNHPNPSANMMTPNAKSQQKPESDRSQQQRSGSAPPDLNVRFNSPSSSSSSAARGELAQPDLALQL